LTVLYFHLDYVYLSSNNRIGRDGPIKLAPALTIHPTLSVFKIGLNPIGDEGVQILLKAAENNPNLRSLGFEVCMRGLY